MLGDAVQPVAWSSGLARRQTQLALAQRNLTSGPERFAASTPPPPPYSAEPSQAHRREPAVTPAGLFMGHPLDCMCGIRFTDKDSYLRHSIAHQTGEIPLPRCPYCDVACCDEATVHRHIVIEKCGPGV